MGRGSRNKELFEPNSEIESLGKELRITNEELEDSKKSNCILEIYG